MYRQYLVVIAILILVGIMTFLKKNDNVNKNDWENFKKTNKDISADFILKKIEERSAAKQKGNFKLADQIRDELLKKGIIIEDQKGKTTWKFK